MKLTYQTANATFIQFVVMVILGLINCITSIISSCHSNSGNCLSNAIPTMGEYILSVGWFGIILAIGYMAQKNRSNRLAGILIGFELVTIVVAGHFNFPTESGWLAKGTSLFDVFISLVVIYLAIQVLLARGHRIVKKGRNRKSSA